MTDDADPHGEVDCSFCGSTDVSLEHRQGSGLCRSLYVCADCEQPFERFG